MINRSDTYSQPFTAEDELIYYFNSESLISTEGFETWTVALVHADSNIIAYDNVFTLTKDIITGNSYRWYFEWIVPVLSTGCFRLVIYDSYEQIKYISETTLQYVSSIQDTAIIKYRNAVNIQNFNYSGLSAFYNQFRIFLKRRSPQRAKNTVGYDFTDGTFNRVRTVITKNYEFVTEYLDENASDAFDVATFHSDVRINIGTGFQRYRLPEDSDFEQEWTEFYNLADASVILELMDYSSSNKSK